MEGAFVRLTDIHAGGPSDAMVPAARADGRLMIMPGNRKPWGKPLNRLHPLLVPLHERARLTERCPCRRFMHELERSSRAAGRKNPMRSWRTSAFIKYCEAFLVLRVYVSTRAPKISFEQESLGKPR